MNKSAPNLEHFFKGWVPKPRIQWAMAHRTNSEAGSTACPQFSLGSYPCIHLITRKQVLVLPP